MNISFKHFMVIISAMVGMITMNAAAPDFYGVMLYSDNSYKPTIDKFRAGYSVEPVTQMDLSPMSGCSGTYMNGDYYYMAYSSNSSGAITSVDWVRIDPISWSVKSKKSQNYAVGVCMDMTFDATTQTIFGISAVSDVLVKIDAETGEATPFAETRPFYTLSADAAGQLFGIALDSETREGVLYSINKLTGNSLKIGSTGVKLLTDDSGSVACFQTAAFSSANGLLYWAVTSYDGASSIYRIDVATGKASYLSSFPEGKTYVGLFEIPEPENPNVPATVEDVKTIVQNGSDYRVTIGFKTPETTAGGESLTKLNSVKIYRTSAETPIYLLDNPEAGAEYSWTDKNPEAGFNVYKIICSNDNGESLPVYTSAFCGDDYPNAPNNIKISNDKDGYPHITWSAPTTGLNGLDLDQSTLKYNVIRDNNGIEEIVGSQITDLHFTDKSIDMSRQSYPYYYVQAISTAGEGKRAFGGGTYVGPPYKLPFEESFGGCNPQTSPWILESIDKGGQWELNYISTFPGSGPYDDDGMLVFIGFRAVEGAEARISTPLLSFEGVNKPELKFHFYYLDMSDEDLLFNDRMIVEVSVDGKEFEPVTDGEFIQHDANTRWTECILPLDKYAGAKRVAIGFHGYSAGGFDLLLDNIKISDANPSELNEIESDQTSGNYKYYNLDGIPIKTPAAGQVLIRKSGNITTKVISR